VIPQIAPSPLSFALERLHDIQPEVNQLWALHYAETEGYRGAPMIPQLDQFYRMEDAGMWRQFTARDDVDGHLVGHLGYMVHVGRHTGVLTATEDFFYLRKEYRGGYNALRLLRFAIGRLKAEGCKQIGMSSKMTNDIEPLLKRVGFDLVAKFYTMAVD